MESSPVDCEFQNLKWDSKKLTQLTKQLKYRELDDDQDRRDRFVVVIRRFDVTPDALYRPYTEPKLIQKWLLGPEGSTMPVCISEARPGGKIRYEWTNPTGGGFYLTGEYLELEPYSRIVHVERMHFPDPTPDNQVETRFEPDGDGRIITMRMTVPDAETRSQMLASGMEHGMEASYVRLDVMI